MSVRWMAVQYVGNTLRLPVVNKHDMDRPFGMSVLERDVERIVVNPFSEHPQVFVPETASCVVRDVNGEPGECMFYVRETEPEPHACPYDCEGVQAYASNGIVHLTVGSLPDAIMVHLPDRRGREVYTARVYRYLRETVGEEDE